MKIGTSFTLDYSENLTITQFISKSKDMGLQVVELVAEPPNCFIDDIDSTSREEIKRHAQKFEMDLTVHATFSDINIAGINERIRNFAVNEIKNCIDFSKDIGSKIVTFHPGRLGALGSFRPKLSQEKNIKSIEEIEEYASKTGVIVGLENMPIMPNEDLSDRISPFSIQNIVNNINSEYLKITWDVGHSHTTQFSFEDFFESFKEQVVHFHLHDNIGPQDGWSDTHLELEKGTMDWKMFFERISTLNKNFTMVFELNTWEKIERSFEIVKNYLS